MHRSQGEWVGSEMVELESLPEILRSLSRRQPEALAAVDGDERFTYKQLEGWVAEWQVRLMKTGVRAGDRVAMLAVPGIAYYACLLATHNIGAIWVGLNPRYTIGEMAHIVGDLEPRLCLYLPVFEGRCYQSDFAELYIQFPKAQFVDIAQFCSDWPRSGNLPELDAAALDPDDAAIIVYTSGSTGAPKGAMLSHRALAMGARAQLRRWNLATVRQVCGFPINHVACTGDVVATTLTAGGTLFFQSRYDPGQIIDAAAAGDINLLLAVPTMIHMIFEHPGFSSQAISNLELVIWGGAPLPRADIERLRALGPRLATLYGMTEAAANTTYTAEDASVDELFETVGRPLPEFPTRIVAGDRVCGAGEDGEIQHRLEFTKLGYWRRPDATHEVTTADGWYRTGDLGRWLEDGNIKLVGRLKEMFKSGGYNVYPREVEIALEESDLVDIAVVVAIPDARYQEVGVAYIVPKPGCAIDCAEIKQFAHTKLANYKVPKFFVLKQNLPLLPVGKVDKPALQREAAEQFAPVGVRA